MKNIYDELWKIPEDTLRLASELPDTRNATEDIPDEMNYLSSERGRSSYDEIKYEIPSDNSQILETKIDYGLYEITEEDKVVKDDVKYISLKYICRNLNRTVEWVEDRDILHNLFCIVNAEGERMYREPEVVERCAFLKIEFRRMDLPYSVYNRMEAAEYLNMSAEEFAAVADKIPSKETILEDGYKYSVYYKKELDKYHRRTRFMDIVANAGVTISPDDITATLGIKGIEYEDFKNRYPMQRRSNADGYPSMRYTSDNVADYIKRNNGNKSIYKELKETISSEMARVYIGAGRREWLSIRYEKKLIKPLRKYNGTKIINSKSGFSQFYLDDLDKYIDEREGKLYYGLGNEFITRQHIKNRYGVNDKWINTYVKNNDDVRIRLSTGAVISWGYYHTSGNKGVIQGIQYSDVEKLIKGGNYIDITKEYVRKRLGIDREEMKKRMAKGKDAILFMHRKYIESKRKSPYQYNEVSPDSIAIAIESSMNEERLILDEKKKVLAKITRDRKKHDNEMRKVLGLTEVEHTAIQKNVVVKNLDTPQIFRCIHKRGNCNVYKQVALPFNTYDYISTIKSFFTKRHSIDKTSLSIKSFIQGMSHCINGNFKVMPSWFIFMDSTTYIADSFLKTRLEALPTDVGVVGSYGWLSIPSDYNWHNSDETYGFYETYSIKGTTTSKHIGKYGCGAVKDVALIGGPIICIRVTLLMDLLKTRLMHGYIVGDDHIGAIVSMYAHAMRKRVCVIDTNVVSCSDYDCYIGSDEWQDDQIEFVMKWERELRKLKNS